MMVGVFVPLVLLLLYEMQPAHETEVLFNTGNPENSGSGESNDFALRILGYAVLFTGILISVLSFGAPTGRLLILVISLLIISIGIVLISMIKNRKLTEKIEKN